MPLSAAGLEAARPPVATEWLSLTEGGLVRCALKTPYRDGTTHVIFEPKEFVVRLAALVPKPRAHLTRFHGVFAPASPDRAQGEGSGRHRQDDSLDQPMRLTFNPTRRTPPLT